MLQEASRSVRPQRSAIQSSQPDERSISPGATGFLPHSDRSVQSVAHAQNLTPQRDAANVIPARPRWLTVSGMATEYKEVITEAALRHLIWSAEAHSRSPRSGRSANGFLPVIVRPPFQRKVLLDRVAFEKWLTTNQS